MKIGIITFHRAHNYGAYLQCFALKKVLCSLGFDVHVINYVPQWMHKTYKPCTVSRFKSLNPLHIINELILLPFRIKRYINFEKLIESQFSLEENCSFESLNKEYDILIIGSDQVWNKAITQGWDNYYWGDFIEKNCNALPKLVAYAPSMETTIMSPQEMDIIKKKLRNFDFLSGREDDMVELLETLTDKPVSKVLDPTFLVDIKVWKEFESSCKVKKPYTFFYQAAYDKEKEIEAHEIAKKKGLRLISLTSGVNKHNTLQMMNSSPQDFLSLVANAEMVITSSFHGIAFSLIYNKPFQLLISDNVKNTRATSLLKKLEIDVSQLSSLEYWQNFNWSLINERIMILKSESLSYIKKTLNC